MSVINYQDIIDLDGYDRALKTLEKTADETSKTQIESLKSIGKQIDIVNAKLKEQFKYIQSLNVNTRDTLKILADFDNEVNKNIRTEQNLKKAQDAGNQNLKSRNDAITQLRIAYSAMNDKVNQFNNSENKTIEGAKQLGAQIKTLTTGTNNLTVALVKSTGYYDELQRKTKAAIVNAKELAAQYGAESKQALEAAEAANVYKQQVADINNLLKQRPKQVQTEIVPTVIATDNSANATGTVVSEAETAALNEQLAAQRELDIEKQNSVSITKEQSKATVEATSFLDQYLGSLQQNLALQLENEIALSKNKAAQKELLTEIKGSGVATDQQTSKLLSLRTEQVALTNESKELRSNINLLSKEFVSADGSIDELRVRVTGLTATYEALSAAEKQSEFGLQVKKQIDIMQPALQSAEAELGKFQRNVGNYPKTITSFFTTAFSQIRTLANIIPGLGVQGIFLFAFQAITKATSALFGFGNAEDQTKQKVKSASDTIKEQQEDLEKFKDSLDNAAASSLASSLKLQAFVNIAKDSEQPLKVRNQALEEANKILGEHGDKLTLVNIQTAAVTEEVKKFTEALIQQAIAAKYADQIANLTIKQINQTKDYKNAVKELNDAFAFNKKLVGEKGLGNVSPFDLADVDLYQNKVKETASILNETSGEILSIQGDFNDSTQKSIQLFGDLGTKSKDGLEKLRKSLQDAYEIQKLFLEDQIKDNKAIAADDDILYTVRADAAQKAAELEMDLSQLTFEFDQKNKKNEILAEKQAALRVKAINIQLNNDLQKIFADRNKFKEPEITAPVDNTEAELAAHKKFINDFIKQVQEGGKAIQTQENINQLDEQKILDDQHDKGLLSEKQYQESTLALQKKYDQLRLQSQITALQAQLSVLDPNSNKAQEIIEQIKTLEAALKKLSATGQATKKDLSGIFDSLLKNIEAVSNISGNAVGSFFQDTIKAFQKFAEDGSASFKDHIDEYAQIAISAGYAITDELNQAAEQRIANLEKDKEHELNLAQNNAAAQQAINEKYAREEAKLKRKEAVANKINALFQIAINTAVAVSESLSTPFLIPFIIGLGLAEEAVVLAQPLPQYEKGTMHAPEGFAVVDEKGSELIVDRHGRLKEVGGDGPRITYLNEGDKVYTASQTREILTKNIIEKQDEINIMREMQLHANLSTRIQEGRRAEAVHIMSEAFKSNTINKDIITAAFKDAVKDIPIFQTIVDAEGTHERMKKRDGLTAYRNTLRIGHKKNK